MNDETTELIPFHALNEFMRSDYRLHVVRTALSAMPKLPAELRSPLEQMVKKHVKVPGFRNSDKAPARLKATPAAQVFEKNPEMTGAVLSAWAEVQSELRQQVYDMLAERGWQVLPLEAKRIRLPGFFINWPESEDFEILHQDFAARYPDSNAGPDDISLMVVWIGMRLPYQKIDDTPENVTKIADVPQKIMSEDEEGPEHEE
jgi:hypothetical protein